MPTTVRELLRAADLQPEGVVPWGIVPPVAGPGVYVVALIESPDSLEGALVEPPLDRHAFERWLERVPSLMLDGSPADVPRLMDRVARFWLPDEVIVYIGKASSLPTRLRDYYATAIGARGPHSGGYFLKVLANLRDLHVHYSRCEDAGRAEDLMLETFCRGVSQTTCDILLDPAHPFPFANLEWPPGTRKAHGIVGAREPRTARSVAAPSRRPSMTSAGMPPDRAPRSQEGRTAGPYRSQRVTVADLRAGQIRIPRATKSLFPEGRADVTVMLRGKLVAARWDPRIGPDRERSGVLRFRDKDTLRASVHDGEILPVSLRNGQLFLQ